MAAPHGICPSGMEQSEAVAWSRIKPAEWNGPVWPTQFYWGLSVITFFVASGLGRGNANHRRACHLALTLAATQI